VNETIAEFALGYHKSQLWSRADTFWKVMLLNEKREKLEASEAVVGYNGVPRRQHSESPSRVQ